MASKRPPAPSWSLSPLPDLPDDMLRSIGLIIVKHSILENLLQMLCYELAGVDEIVGRLMFREPRTVDRLNLLQELAKLQGIDISKHKISNLRKSVEVATNARDAVAHGLFFQSPDDGPIRLRMTTGSWQPPGINNGKVSRKVQPSAKPVDADQLDGLVKHCYNTNQSLIALLQDVRAQLSRLP